MYKETLTVRDMYQLWFCNIKGVGQKTRTKLMSEFLTAEAVYNAEAKALREVLTGIQNIKIEEIVNAIMESKNLDKIEQYAMKLQERDIHITYPGKADYPKKLLDIYDPPHILYIRGILKPDMNIYNNSIGIVGSRKMDSYGKEIAYKFAKDLAKDNITIISGLARGIDSMAHKGALDANGYTIAVLGCGINVTYPPENGELYERIMENGAIISEYGLDEKPNAGYFPMRNRIISGLSDGVLVVEAEKKSGSLITVDCALEQGRQVYAVPGRIYDTSSEGTNNLIKSGAMCVTTPKDIIVDLRGETFDIKVEKNSLAPEMEKVYSCLSLDPVYIDDIIQRTRFGVSKTISLLYTMELQGIIKQPLKGYYVISI